MVCAINEVHNADNTTRIEYDLNKTTDCEVYATNYLDIFRW